jgi:hypothetical protein
MTTRSTRLAMAAIVTCTSSVTLYACLRVGQSIFLKEPDPAQIILSAHVGYYWRAAIALYVGTMLGFAMYVVAARAPRSSAELVSVSVLIATIAITAQGLLLP